MPNSKRSPAAARSELSRRRGARLELERRRRARTDLCAFANAVEIPGKPSTDDPDEWLFRPIETSVAAHHLLLMRGLQRIAQTPHGRMMVFMPPGSAKSTYGSVVFPAWFMGTRPGARIILASYGAELARKHGRRARQIARSGRYRAIFNAELSRESGAAAAWALTNGSEYMASGILAGITGNRAHGVLIDDPVKGREEADSATIRKKTRDAYEDDLKTRLVPGGWIVLIQTRWHEDDLAGSILPQGWNGESGPIPCRDGNVWEVLCLSAQCDLPDDPLGRRVGEYLWPEWFDPGHWAQFQHNARTWSALYQQRPTPAEGTYFKSGWLRRYAEAPARTTLRIYGASDYAVTAEGGDFTVHLVAGMDPKGDLYLLDLWRGQTTPDIWIEAWCDLVQKWAPTSWAEETGQIRAAVGPFLERRANERKAWTVREQFPTRHDKAVRAQSIRGRAASRGLYLPDHAPWTADFESELLRFPAGLHDDQVDALGLIGQLLDRMNAGPAAPPPEKLPEPPDLRRWRQDDTSWRL